MQFEFIADHSWMKSHKGGGNHPRKDTQVQPNTSDLRDHPQSISGPILSRLRKKVPPLNIDRLKCGIRPPDPKLFGGPLCERTERDRDMKISSFVDLDTADALK